MVSKSRLSQANYPRRLGGEVAPSLFSALNPLIESTVRTGLWSIWLLPVGLIVLETIGRKTGVPQRVPLLAATILGHVVVSTIRVGQSQWLRNALENPEVRYWLRGQELRARAIVLMSGRETPVVTDEDAACLVEALRPVVALGAAFVILPHRRDRLRGNGDPFLRMLPRKSDLPQPIPSGQATSALVG